MPAIPRTSETSFVNHISQRHICLLETTAACDVYTIWRCKHLRNSFGFCNFTIPPASTLDTQTWPIRMEKVNLLAHWVRNHQRLQSDRGHVYGLNCRLSARKCAIWGLGGPTPLKPSRSHTAPAEALWTSYNIHIAPVGATWRLLVHEAPVKDVSKVFKRPLKILRSPWPEAT